MMTRKLIYYSFFALQFMVILALIKTDKADYLKDVAFTTLIIAIYIFLEFKYNLSISNYIRVCVLLLVSRLVIYTNLVFFV
ncbi:hypothetical protein Pmgp_00834 [Pelotomaculum propionicicum]|uniref:Uncharacterized protein n=1 Tax=Pelotomaculum propionicicum TaxID=258475 RepID=A0A4Y7RUF1_9FIRM|nr:hypothetical protein Pmgp_00834 [Pelotomaculum propionicicum]